MEIIALRIGVIQEGSPFLLLIKCQRSLYQISDGILRRHQHLHGSNAVLDSHSEQHLRWPKKNRVTVVQRKLERERSGGEMARVFLRQVLPGEYSPMTGWCWSHAYKDKNCRFLFSFFFPRYVCLEIAGNERYWDEFEWEAKVISTKY